MRSSNSEYSIQESSILEEGVLIGRETRIQHFCHIRAQARIGERCLLGDYVYVDRGVQIGNEVNILERVLIYQGVTLEDRVFCGPGVIFTNLTNPRAFIECKDEVRPTLLRRGATVGAGATIVCGITLGRYSFAGAGAVVTRDVPDFGLVYGNPAKQTGWVCRCGTKLLLRLLENSPTCTCVFCESRFSLQDGRLLPMDS